MEGRLEHKIHNEKMTERRLENLPELVRDYYMSRVSSKESTGLDGYIKRIEMFLRYLNSDTKSIDVTKITEGDVSRFLHSIEKTVGRDGVPRETSFGYRKQVYSILNSFFEYLRKRRIITENPLDCIERPTTKDVVKRQRLDAFDINFILECIDGGAGSDHAKNRSKPWRIRDKAIITLLCMTGMRETALTEINIEDIDFASGTIKVIDKRHKTHIYKMNDVLRKALTNWIKDREEKLSGMDVDALFISNRNQRISRNMIVDIVKRYSLEGLGYSVSPHKLRAAYCTILYDTTHDIEFVRKAVGHANVETTMRYIVDDDTAKDEAAEYMQKIFG